MVMYTDDIKVLITDSYVCAFQRKIDRVIAQLEIWFNSDDLVINKTGFMSFHNRLLKFLIKPQVSFNK